MASGLRELNETLHFFLGISLQVFLGTLKHWGASVKLTTLSHLMSWLLPAIWQEIPRSLIFKIYNLTASLDFGKS